MFLPADEKLILVEQLEGIVGSAPLFYLKFTGCQTYADDVKDGNLYANTPEWFRKRELQSGQRGQGDQFELLQIIDGFNLRFISDETNEVSFVIPRAKVTVKINDDDNKPIVSFIGIRLRDMILESADESRAVFSFPFTDDEYAKMEDDFGKYCVFVDAKQLLNKVKHYSIRNQVAFLFDKVKYCPQNTIQRMQAFGDGVEDRFLYKNEDLAYQREYRLVFDMDIPKDHFIRLGEFRDAANTITSDELRNLRVEIKYESHRIE